jgi:hypothetical protein
MTTLTYHLTRWSLHPVVRSLVLILVCGALVSLTGCTTATAAVTKAGTDTMNGVKAFSMFAAIGIAIYWITYVVFFGLRNAWPEGYNTISQSWKAGAFVTIITVIGLPALLGWANGVVTAGGFTAAP